jgi:hypothetical protein
LLNRQSILKWRLACSTHAHIQRCHSEPWIQK